ncbi:MAG: hypothetical protein QXL20_05505 [Candidatus Bathyarchaeia archaeon]
MEKDLSPENWSRGVPQPLVLISVFLIIKVKKDFNADFNISTL